ncbi:MAG: pyruvate kinase [bacterium]|nr:pyruvate kinase [bacterium]
MFRNTKIMATIGPACQSVAILEQMIHAGLNIARLNFSHGTHETHAEAFHNLKLAEKNTGVKLTIVQDLQGPKIRLGIMPANGIEIAEGEEIILNTALTEYNDKEIPLAFPGLQKFLKAGERLLLDDGHMEVKVLEVKGTKVYCSVVEGGTVFSHKGVNVPDSHLDIPALAHKDKDDLKFGLSLGINSVALSFVHTADDVIGLRALIKKYEQAGDSTHEYPVQVIVKIERKEAMHNLKSILEECDGVMVARGDLGLDVPVAEVPLMQKKIIAMSKALAKPVIVATQMLDSMQEKRHPSRAEVSDVANAVFDQADVLMLSNETAAGKYPVKTVKMMNQIIHTTEKHAYTAAQSVYEIGETATSDIAITQSACVLAEDVGAKYILAASLSGDTGRLVSSLRPYLPIFVATSSDRVLEQLNLSWGVTPIKILPCKSLEELMKRAFKHLKEANLVESGDKVVVLAGEPVGQAGNLNLIEVKEIE